jgi:5-methylcytosine-specific restriction endonuclease McrA
MANKVSTESEFSWDPIPSDGIEKLAKNLQNRARSDDGLSVSIADCRKHTASVLAAQGGTCLFAGGDHKYCWNEPKESERYLKLQCAHMVPKSHAPKASLDNFALLCARCNNHIQSSRTLEQVSAELKHKLRIIDSILKREARE